MAAEPRFIVYTPKKFRAGTLDVIEKARQICDDYRAQGYDLTLRQIYYQFVARDWLPNRQSEYKRLGSILNDARLAGKLDWTAMVDRTRNLMALPHFNDPSARLSAAAQTYNIDLWAPQPTRIEVWVEKDALVGILNAVCPNHDVAYFSCRGYTSQTEVWGAAQRIGTYLAAGQNVVLLHLGDHDPSGLDMTRDITDRLKLFFAGDEQRAHTAWLQEQINEEKLPRFEENASNAWKAKWQNQITAVIQQREWADFEIRRIALNLDQVEQYNLPPNPAKQSDARWRSYVAETGLHDSWELDALEPTVLAGLINDEIELERDDNAWAEAIQKEEDGRDLIQWVAENWEAVLALREAS